MNNYSQQQTKSFRNVPIHNVMETLIPFNDEQINYRQPKFNRNVRIQTELTAIRLDDEAENYQRYKRTKNVGIQAAFTDVILDDNVKNKRKRSRNPTVNSKNDSTHQFDRTDENLNREVTRDQRQTMIPKEDSTIDRNTTNQQDQKLTETVTKDITKSDGTEISPILGYSEEPLLPLAQACAPLTDIFHNLSFYVELALKETPEQPPDGLSVDESAAIRLYTIEWDKPHRSLYSTLNFNLKNNDRQALLPFHRYIKLFLTALVKLPCVPPLTVWRGVTKNLSAEFPPGSGMTWWAFSSCTTEMTVLENNMYLGQEGDRTLFSVEAMNGRTIKAHSHFVTEDEIVLMSGTHMIVQSQLSPAANLYIIHLKQVEPDIMTLERPFEGAHIYPKIPRPFYRKKRFMIPTCLLLTLFIAGVIIGVILGTKSKNMTPLKSVCNNPFQSQAIPASTGNYPSSAVLVTLIRTHISMRQL
ncbi:unnamed protein product [Adineta steineri]|uniref:NAD(P)(+)--arginine ADP-ribosyltransferase n=2 Tax=Adineta steineri TaxID=433720 RepID=A0A815HEG7_9BILA|nr:unnamed protein product [Adineta steineri]